MLELNAQHIHMHQAAADKPAALALLGEVLVADGLVAPGYLDGLRAREAQGSTFLGQGIAIPHGTPETRDQVFITGVRLLHFPAGVDWGNGQQVYLAIGIAARSDEHLRLLQLLTRALGEGDLSEALQKAQSPEAIIDLLQGAPQALALDGELVGLGVVADDFDELAWQGVKLLKRAQCVEPGFNASLPLGQSLPLGDGLWWLSSEQSVQRPGLAFITPVSNLEHQGQPLNGLFVLASMGEAHQAMLERLCNLLIEGRGQELSQATSSRTVLEALGGEVPADWPSAQVPLANAHGLHARPAKVLTEIAQSFEGEIRVRQAGSENAGVSVKSLSKLLAMGAQRGQVLEFMAEPGIAGDALPALVRAVEEGLGEEIEPLPIAGSASEPLEITEGPAASAIEQAALRAGEQVNGIAASPGIAIGPVLVRKPQVIDYPKRGESPPAELQRLDAALDKVHAEIGTLIEESQVASIRDIFTTHQAMLKDPALREEVQVRLQKGLSAEAAWMEEIDSAAQQQEALHDKLLAERAADLRDVGRRVLACLTGVEAEQAPDEPYILVMDEVAPSDVATLNAQRVAGILTAGGGATSHSAIIARALGIPAIVGAGPGVLGLAPNTLLLLDGERGELLVAPTDAQLEQARSERATREERKRLANERRLEPAITRDGHPVEIAANIGAAGETPEAVAMGAEGIGLLRTELVFMNHAQAPDQATQEAEYRRVLEALEGRPLVVRTLDVGGDKPLPYWPMPAEENPFLGVRGIRLSLQRPDILETQLRALLASAEGRPLRIMFPMVGNIDEWRSAKAMVDRLRQELPVADLQVGIMIEIPSAALIAPVLAQEVDFFSIGTNDLTQYTLAIDRGHPTLSGQADGLHPAVLRLIGMTVEAAHAHGKWVGVCGELAADALAVPMLVGLGVDELSVSARSIALVKARVRELDFAACQQLAKQALMLPGAHEVRAFVGEHC
ncbi:phosphoenolpyruvate--protein phosphotransferase [Stutzerimonas stutzeri]|jgi:multiphosphoryl transfer protein|uniref:phosphoenolpyruvate--protein phosphotransferase n=1 Tax=Stutzerimonas stutzeri TaxID=316 RepID=A0A5S5BCB5_STUST|nr:phosphoenolpyruvate--protein phosphotransferase [Stutzerimonas stutzeri]TYP63363.1 phosphocarrier protein HPr /phosphoenolpyruvate--protein phosphotransferase /PTS system D-fructose-specific IIA component (F1P-forming) (Frc family) [Stutzerimonas stutzeri]